MFRAFQKDCEGYSGHPPAPAGLGLRGPANLPAGPGGPAAPAGPKAPEKDGKYKARQVDKFSRKSFPISFVLFNIIYWAYYTPLSSQETAPQE